MEITLNTLTFKGNKITDSKLPKIKKGNWKVAEVNEQLIVSHKEKRNAYVETDKGWYQIKLW